MPKISPNDSQLLEEVASVPNPWLDLFKEGYYCSEQILRVYNEKLNLELDEKALRMATGFGVGMGCSKCSCGYVTGSVLVLSALKGRTTTAVSEQELFDAVSELHKRFRAKYKVICCRVLTKKVEWGTPEHIEHCSQIGLATSEILDALLAEKGWIENANSIIENANSISEESAVV
jgi:C_GCAxxG_C_C family probable redox protein